MRLVFPLLVMPANVLLPSIKHLDTGHTRQAVGYDVFRSAPKPMAIATHPEMGYPDSFRLSGLAFLERLRHVGRGVLTNLPWIYLTCPWRRNAAGSVRYNLSRLGRALN